MKIWLIVTDNKISFRPCFAEKFKSFYVFNAYHRNNLGLATSEMKTSDKAENESKTVLSFFQLMQPNWELWVKMIAI